VSGFRVVICGGGVAALEGLLRLRRLAGDSLDITLVAPNDQFVYRPRAVLDPADSGPPRGYPLRDVAKDGASDWIKDTIDWIDSEARVAHTAGGRELSFDSLLVAVGGRQLTELDHALTFRDACADEVHDHVVGDVVAGRAASVAFVLPEGSVYPLPVYELALMTAELARAAGVAGLDLHLITAEPTPLAVFGGTAGATVAALLRQAGVKLHTSSTAYVPAPNRLLVQPIGAELEPSRIVAMPRVSGPGIRGLPGGGPHGFTPIDRHCAVPDTGGRVFAAGDATAFPIKHGSLAAQQADIAASAIAHLAGAATEPASLNAEIKGKLFTGSRPLYLSARLVGGQGFESEVSESPPWPVDDKIVALELGPYLSRLDTR
jgi:sulfide:quinone oxidoreductase